MLLFSPCWWSCTLCILHILSLICECDRLLDLTTQCWNFSFASNFPHNQVWISKFQKFPQNPTTWPTYPVTCKWMIWVYAAKLVDPTLLKGSLFIAYFTISSLIWCQNLVSKLLGQNFGFKSWWKSLHSPLLRSKESMFLSIRIWKYMNTYLQELYSISEN